MRRNLPQLNIIRAIASLGVAIFHLGGKALPILKWGWLGVEMFFVLTGFVICWSLPENYSLKNFPTFIWKRLARVEPPYILSIFIIIFLSFLLSEMKNINFINILFHFAYLNNFLNNNYLSPVYWTLGIEFQYYIFIGLLFPLIFYSNKTSILFLILLNAIAYFYPSPYSIVLNFISFFSLGIIVYMYKSNRIQTSILVVLAILNILVIYFINGIPPTIAAILTMLIILFFEKSNPIIDFFSKISFSLYLTHDIIASRLVVYIGNKFIIKTIFTKGFAFSIGIIVSIVLAYFFYILIEKRALSLSKKLVYSV